MSTKSPATADPRLTVVKWSFSIEWRILWFMSGDQMRLGLKAMRAGDRREARRIFAAIVHDAPDDAAAWWHLALVTDDSEQKAQFLRQVLKIMPDHDESRRLLASVEHQIARPTPAKGVSRPIADADARGVELNPASAASNRAAVPASTAVRAPLVTIALFLLLALSIGTLLVLRSRAPAVPSTPEHVDPGFTLGVEQCVTTGGSGATLTFVNHTGFQVTVFRGNAGQEVSLGSLPPEAQQIVETIPDVEVRYSVKTVQADTLTAGATIQVPAGSSCTVLIR